MATSPLPFQGAKSGRNCFVTPAFSGVPNKGDKIRSGYITHAFSGAQKWAELLRNTGVLGVPNKGEKIRSGYITLPLQNSFMMRGGRGGGGAAPPLLPSGSYLIAPRIEPKTFQVQVQCATN